MWKEFLKRLVESFAAADPVAYCYYLSCKRIGMNSSETYTARGRVDSPVVVLGQPSPNRDDRSIDRPSSIPRPIV